MQRAVFRSSKGLLYSLILKIFLLEFFVFVAVYIAINIKISSIEKHFDNESDILEIKFYTDFNFPERFSNKASFDGTLYKKMTLALVGDDSLWYLVDKLLLLEHYYLHAAGLDKDAVQKADNLLYPSLEGVIKDSTILEDTDTVKKIVRNIVKTLGIDDGVSSPAALLTGKLSQYKIEKKDTLWVVKSETSDITYTIPHKDLATVQKFRGLRYRYFKRTKLDSIKMCLTVDSLNKYISKYIYQNPQISTIGTMERIRLSLLLMGQSIYGLKISFIGGDISLPLSIMLLIYTIIFSIMVIMVVFLYVRIKAYRSNIGRLLPILIFSVPAVVVAAIGEKTNLKILFELGTLLFANGVTMELLFLSGEILLDEHEKFYFKLLRHMEIDSPEFDKTILYRKLFPVMMEKLPVIFDVIFIIFLVFHDLEIIKLNETLPLLLAMSASIFSIGVFKILLLFTVRLNEARR